MVNCGSSGPHDIAVNVVIIAMIINCKCLSLNDFIYLKNVYAKNGLCFFGGVSLPGNNVGG